MRGIKWNKSIRATPFAISECRAYVGPNIGGNISLKIFVTVVISEAGTEQTDKEQTGTP